jgi:hypothetical protein
MPLFGKSLGQLSRRIGVVLGVVVAAPYALYFGIVLGGSLGGGCGEKLFGALGILPGIVAGFSVVAGTILFVGACVGLGFAPLFDECARMLRRALRPL